MVLNGDGRGRSGVETSEMVNIPLCYRLRVTRFPQRYQEPCDHERNQTGGKHDEVNQFVGGHSGLLRASRGKPCEAR